jgi:hypothetical protein
VPTTTAAPGPTPAPGPTAAPSNTYWWYTGDPALICDEDIVRVYYPDVSNDPKCCNRNAYDNSVPGCCGIGVGERAFTLIEPLVRNPFVVVCVAVEVTSMPHKVKKELEDMCDEEGQALWDNYFSKLNHEQFSKSSEQTVFQQPFRFLVEYYSYSVTNTLPVWARPLEPLAQAMGLQSSSKDTVVLVGTNEDIAYEGPARCVVAFSASDDLSDFIDNSNFVPISFCGLPGMYHSGYVKQFRQVVRSSKWKKLAQTFHEKECTMWYLQVVGFSLGSVMASLFTACVNHGKHNSKDYKTLTKHFEVDTWKTEINAAGEAVQKKYEIPIRVDYLVTFGVPPFMCCVSPNENIYSVRDKNYDWDVENEVRNANEATTFSGPPEPQLTGLPEVRVIHLIQGQEDHSYNDWRGQGKPYVVDPMTFSFGAPTSGPHWTAGDPGHPVPWQQSKYRNGYHNGFFWIVPPGPKNKDNGPADVQFLIVLTKNKGKKVKIEEQHGFPLHPGPDFAGALTAKHLHDPVAYLAIARDLFMYGEEPEHEDRLLKPLKAPIWEQIWGDKWGTNYWRKHHKDWVDDHDEDEINARTYGKVMVMKTLLDCCCGSHEIDDKYWNELLVEMKETLYMPYESCNEVVHPGSQYTNLHFYCHPVMDYDPASGP